MIMISEGNNLFRQHSPKWTIWKVDNSKLRRAFATFVILYNRVALYKNVTHKTHNWPFKVFYNKNTLELRIIMFFIFVTNRSEIYIQIDTSL